MKPYLFAVAMAVAAAACTTTNPDVVSRQDAQRLSTVLDGTIVSVRDVVVDGTQSGLGGAAGGVIGGVAGSSLRGNRESAIGGVIGAVVGGVVGNQFGAGTGRALATGAGVVGGAVAGNAVESRNKRDDEVFRVGVRLDSGVQRYMDFHRVDDLRVGDRIRFDNGQLYRN